MATQEKKGSILYVLEILQRYSDKKHPLNYSDIIEKLDNEYDLQLERKTVAGHIDLLMSLGYDIIKEGKKGVYLGARSFEDGELRFLIDTIYSSRSMPTQYAKDLVSKLTKDCSIYDEKRFRYLEKVDDGSKANNKQLFLTIEILDNAIAEKKKVEFQYSAYGVDKKLTPKKEGKTYKVNPYYMVNNRGSYYLVCNTDKYDNLANYKIECISNVKILNEMAKPIKSLPGQENFSIKEYVSEHIYMMAGQSVRATIKVEDEKSLNDVISWFGNKISIWTKTDGFQVDLIANENSLIFWALQYGERVEVVEPQSTREKIRQILATLTEKYKNK